MGNTISPLFSDQCDTGFGRSTSPLGKLGVEVGRAQKDGIDDPHVINGGDVAHTKASFLQSLADSRGVSPAAMRKLGKTFRTVAQKEATAAAGEIFGERDWWSVDNFLSIGATDILEAAQRMKEHTPPPRWVSNDAGATLKDEFHDNHKKGPATWLA